MPASFPFTRFSRTVLVGLCGLIPSLGVNSFAQEAAPIVIRTVQDCRGPIATPPLGESAKPAPKIPTGGPLPLGKSVELTAPEKIALSGRSASKTFFLFLESFKKGVEPLFTLHVAGRVAALINPKGADESTEDPLLDLTTGAAQIQKEKTATSRRELEEAPFFWLNSPHAVLGIRGTEVSLFAAPDQTIAAVIEGVATLEPSPDVMDTDNLKAFEFAVIDADQQPKVWKLSDKPKLKELGAAHPEILSGNWAGGFRYLPTGPGWLIEDFEEPDNPNTKGFDPGERGFEITGKPPRKPPSQDQDPGKKEARDPSHGDGVNYFWPHPDLTLHFPPTDINRYSYLTFDFRLAKKPPHPARNWTHILVYLGQTQTTGSPPHILVDLKNIGARSESDTRWHRIILDLQKYPATPKPYPQIVNALYLRAIADKDFTLKDLKKELGNKEKGPLGFDQIGLYHLMSDLQSDHFSLDGNAEDTPSPATIIRIPLRQWPVGTSETALTALLDEFQP